MVLTYRSSGIPSAKFKIVEVLYPLSPVRFYRYNVHAFTNSMYYC